MGVATAFLRQYAIWSAKVSYDRYGMPIRSSPVEVKCRWETVNQEFLLPDGTVKQIDAWVAVDRAMGLGDTLVLGTLSEYLGTGSSDEGEEEVVHEIVTYEEIPAIRGSAVRREVRLARFRSTQPETGS